MIWAITSGIIAIIGLFIYLAGKKEKSHVNDNFVQLQSDGSWVCPHCHYKNTQKGLCENCLFMPSFEFIDE